MFFQMVTLFVLISNILFIKGLYCSLARAKPPVDITSVGRGLGVHAPKQSPNVVNVTKKGFSQLQQQHQQHHFDLSKIAFTIAEYVFETATA